jgi:histidinol-phosphate phosphatase family protein
VKIIPEAIAALSLSMAKSYKIVIVTNQSVVGRGLISLETAIDINSRLIDLIHAQGGQVDGIYMCPHKPEDDCSCRKPKPGLLLQAAQDLSLDLQHSWMIGDAWSDVQAGRTAGVQQTILLTTWQPSSGIRRDLQPRQYTGYWHLILVAKNISGWFRNGGRKGDFWLRLLLDHLYDHVLQHQVNILDMFDDVAPDMDVDIYNLSQTTTIEACKSNRCYIMLIRFFDGIDHILRIATGRNSNDNIPGSDQIDQLL